MLAVPAGLILMISLVTPMTQPQPQPSSLLANRIMDATQMEYSPEFTDLYLIETADRFRSIQIYCNASSCYKVRGVYKFV
ncbi:hypothetical protein [Oceanobacter mangrovi]|uniref:hypothetical protein n=1 Tax=Oceanobacter mangrovi TaxID=2862510 RepID=UPI001C8EE374|nr:hypothetical protein [Oceanobacter mangrovi]